MTVQTRKAVIQPDPYQTLDRLIQWGNESYPYDLSVTWRYTEYGDAVVTAEWDTDAAPSFLPKPGGVAG